MLKTENQTEHIMLKTKPNYIYCSQPNQISYLVLKNSTQVKPMNPKSQPMNTSKYNHVKIRFLPILNYFGLNKKNNQNRGTQNPNRCTSLIPLAKKC